MKRLLFPLFAVCIFVCPAGAQSELFSFAEDSTRSFGQRGAVLAFNRAGDFAAVGAADGQVTLLSLPQKSGALRPLAQHGRPVSAVTFTRDGSWVVSAGQDGTIQVSPVAPGGARQIKYRGTLLSLAVSAENQFIAAGLADKSIIVWNFASGQELARLPYDGKKPILAMGFTAPGGSLVGVSEWGDIWEWDVATRAVKRRLQDQDRVQCAAVSYGGSLVALGTELGLITSPLGGGGPRDMRRENRIKIYNLQRGAVDKVLEGILGQVTSVSFSADDRFVGVVRQRPRDSFLDVYDLARAVSVASVPLRESGLTSTFSPGGHWLGATTDKGTVMILAVKGVQPGYGPGDLRGVKMAMTSSRETPLIAAAQPTTLAVMSFDSTGLGDATYGATVADSIRTRLAGTNNIRLVDRQHQDEVIKAQNFQYSSRADPATAVRLGKMLGVRQMVFGRLSRLGTDFILNIRLIDVETGEEASREAVCRSCELSDLPELVAFMGPKLLQ